MLPVLRSLADLRYLDSLRGARPLVLVPTMGALHEGHLSLVRRSAASGDFTVVTIFVNPTQFGPNEDFSKYPRDFARDEELCRRESADIVFYPSAADMYPSDSSVAVVEEKLSRGLCGATRPGHFRGVCTVVAKLFNLVQPDVAVFGEKDLVDLTLTIAAMNAINRLGVSFRLKPRARS